jgi:hypothetical protein
MRGFFRPVTLGVIVATAFVFACGDFTSEPSVPPAPTSDRMHTLASAPAAGTCTSLSALTPLVNSVFGVGTPNANSAIGKLNNIDQQIRNGNIATAKEHAFTLVEFILDKTAPGNFPGTTQQLTDLINGILCYSGLGIVITDPFNTDLVYPTDAEQTIVSSNGQAGTRLPGGPVTEPTFIGFTTITGTFPPGGGPLDTKLDQYAGYIGLTHASENNSGFTQPVTVAVCPPPGISANVRARLRLGHDASAGFEITPPADGSFIQCPTQTSSASRGFFGKLARLVLPRELHARQEFGFGGGVGGTAGEYSAFGPVDPVIGFGGGVGGTAGEYVRTFGDITQRRMSTADLISGNGCNPIEAPIGTPVDAACLPFVTVTTNLGTVLSGVPVSWQVTAGAGSIAPRSSAVCGAFGSTANTNTAATGKTGICWTLGTAGTNTVVATPSVGGDADPGVIFNPASFTFNAIANPPVGIVYTQQPPASVTAGNTFGVDAKIVDKYGNTVLGANNNVTLSLNQNTFANGSTSTNANATSGLVTFANLQINTAATGYQLTANGAFVTAPGTAAASTLFDVVPGAAASIAIVAGNNQTAFAGTVLLINPTVAVSDQYGNRIPGVGISWATGGSSASSVSPTSSTTGATGTASTAWTVGDGANELTAAVTSAPTISTLFNATGTTTLVKFNECLPGGSGDPINDVGKTYAFYIPNPGNNKTIREIQLYLSSSGKANVPTQYSIQLTTQLGTFNPAISVPVATTTNVFLRGNNSENKLTTFKLTTPIAGSANGPDIMMRLSVLSNPDASTINFNTGPCAPGTNCRPVSTCKATEVNSLTPYPAGTLYRKSVGIIVKGS